MKTRNTDRGFTEVVHPTYSGAERVIVKESSICDGTSKHDDLPGSSRLWLGDHHLTHDDVVDLMVFLQTWLETGRLAATTINQENTSHIRCRNCLNFKACRGVQADDAPWLLGCKDFSNSNPEDSETVAKLARMMFTKEK